MRNPSALLRVPLISIMNGPIRPYLRPL